MSNKVLVFCPVFNELHHLELLIKNVKSARFNGDFYFFDSGSNDGSSEIIKKSGFQYIRIEKNLGIGFVIITAIKFALKNKYDIVCVISGNNKMKATEINKLINPIISEDYDFVQGSRFISYKEDNNTPKFRRLAIPILSRFVSLLFNQNLTDVTCGFRAFKLSLIERANFKYDSKWLYGYAFEPYFYSNVIIDKKIKKLEVPVSMEYPNVPGVKYTKIKPILNYSALFFPYLIAKLFHKGFSNT